MDQFTLIPSEVELSADFYAALEGASVPLDVHAGRALSKHPMALDVYTWLAHCLCRVRSRELAGLMIDHEVGITSRTLSIPKIDSDYFEDEAV